MHVMLLQSLGGLIAVIGYGVLDRVPGKFLLWCGLDGAFGWFLYLLFWQMTGSVLAATFFGAAAISVGAHICARIFRTPVTMFLIPSNMTLVPGAGMYRIVYYILQSEGEKTAYYLAQTLLAAGMIAMAMFLVNSIMEKIPSGVRKKEKIQNK